MRSLGPSAREELSVWLAKCERGAIGSQNVRMVALGLIRRPKLGLSPPLTENAGPTPDNLLSIFFSGKNMV